MNKLRYLNLTNAIQGMKRPKRRIPWGHVFGFAFAAWLGWAGTNIVIAAIAAEKVSK